MDALACGVGVVWFEVKPDDLTGRHLMAAEMAFEGLTARHIAAEFGLSTAAAHSLLNDVFAKVGVSNRRELEEVWVRDRWEATLGRIRRSIDRHGHSRVPVDYVDEGGHLAGLLVNIRHHHAGLAGVSPGPFPGIDYAAELGSVDGWEWYPSHP
jgi:DNA-binding CsgD family transcriptional regulator